MVANGADPAYACASPEAEIHLPNPLSSSFANARPGPSFVGPAYIVSVTCGFA